MKYYLNQMLKSKLARLPAFTQTHKYISAHLSVTYCPVYVRLPILISQSAPHGQRKQAILSDGEQNLPVEELFQSFLHPVTAALGND